MKKLLLTAVTALTVVSVNAQTPHGDFLDINYIRAGVYANGTLFADSASSTFEVPQGSGKSTIAVSNLWIGGFDAMNNLKIAGQTYRQSGDDFWPGPLDIAGATNPATIAAYNKVWKLNQCDIDAYLAWVIGGNIGPNPVDAATMSTILSWPSTIAPYYDNNVNGIYEPYAGDVPQIKGDQAIFFVFNDKGGVHTETGGAAIGVEIQAMIYAYGCPGDEALSHTIFANYKILNKGSFTLDSMFIGNWSDLEIGGGGDDYFGSDVSRGAYYGYNADSNDYAYGLNPPAQAVVFLAGPYADPNAIDDAPSTTPNGTNYGDGIPDNERLGMCRAMYYNNDFTATGNPSVANQFYNYLTGYWNDSTGATYGGSGHLTGVQAHYMFPGNSDPSGFGTNMIPQPAWDELSTGTVPGDRRGMGSSGPFTFSPGMQEEVEFAYVYGRAATGGNLASVAVMNNYIDSVKQKYSNGIVGCGCAALTGIHNNSNPNNSMSVYPNPASDQITISFTSKSKNISLQIFDTQGRLVKTIEQLNSGENTINVSELESGLYLISVIDGHTTSVKRFVKN